ncbi:transcription factor atoh8 [Mobula birostris]|uniref:transcription factor atoh8 n=1 Tax=Mobula birostris TaxID=1983395 RepID=UPI003B28CCF9
MRTSENLDVTEWNKLCVKRIGTIKRLKRKNRDVLRHVEMEKVHRAQLDPLIARLAEGTGCFNGTARDNGSTVTCKDPRADVVDLRRIAAVPSVPAGGVGRGREDESPAPGRGKLTRAPQSQTCAFEPPALTEPPSLQPRIVLCQHTPGGSYTSVPHANYSPSPRKRPGETSNTSTEIKAIQQTRRLLANARERTRVHTISAAFEALRKQVPCYSYGQKLSKLAILRIACNYILSLARLADLDYSSDHSNMSFSECVEQCTKTLQAEGRSKKRKE